MKRVHSALLLASLVLCTACSGLKASLDFGSKEAKINVASGSKLYISSSNMSVDGTLEVAADSILDGEIISFNGGVFTTNGLDARLNGELNPDGSDSINLVGNGTFDVQPGTVIQSVNVSGEGNVISGQPSFASPIVLVDSDAVLTLGVQSVIDQDIQLHGGALQLSDNLALADNARIVGDGTILLNKRRLDLGSTYTGNWDGSLAFYQALDLTLNGSVSLTGVWNFTGNNVINGNGAVLDLSGGGQLWVGLGSTLQLNNIVIKGLGDNDSDGKLVYASTDGVIRTSNTTLQFNSDYSLVGQLYVQGSSTLALGSNSVSVSDTGSVVVDGSTLWLDALDAKATPGTVYVPTTSSGTISYLNGGDIQAADNKGPSSWSLLTKHLAGSIVLDSSVTLDPGQRMYVDGDVIVDGNGSYVEFMDPNFPQLVMTPGSHLTLKNIEFRNLKVNSFDLRATTSDLAINANSFSSARILIDQNVKWKLDTDITFTNGTIEILDSDNLYNTFVMSSQGTPKIFYVAPLLDAFGGTSSDNSMTFSLSHNTLQLENITFRGLDHVSATVGTVAPAIALSGNAAIDQDVEFNHIDIFVENEGNQYFLRNSLIPDLISGVPVYTDFTIASNIRFGDSAINQLTVRFSTTETTQPALTIDADPGIQLTSANGIATLEFADQNVTLNLATSNAFIIDSHGVLLYKNLFIQDFPIKQQATDFLQYGPALGGTGIDASFVRLPERVKKNAKRMSALEIKRLADAKALANPHKSANKVKKAAPARLTAAKIATKVAKRAPIKRKPVARASSRGLDLDKETRAAKRTIGEVRDATQPAYFIPTAPFNSDVHDTVQTQGYQYTFGCRFVNATIGGADAVSREVASFDAAPGFNGDCFNTQIEIYTPMTLDDSIKLNFAGPGSLANPNVLVIGDAVTIVSTADSLSGLGLAKNTTLEIRVVGDGQLTFDGDFVVPDGCNVSFTQDKTAKSSPCVLFTGDSSINMMGATNSSTQVKLDTSVDLSGDCRVTGKGSFVFGSNGKFNSQTSMLILGADRADESSLHDIAVRVENGAKLTLPPSGAISSRFGTFSYRIGSVIDLAGGVLIFNNGGTIPEVFDGTVTSVVFEHGGGLKLSNYGRFVFGQNARMDGLATPASTTWDGTSGVFTNADGTGTVQLVSFVDGYDESVTGIVADTSKFQVNGAFKADELLLPIMQQNAGFQNTVYKQGDDTKVRSVNGRVIATLATGATIKGESVNGNFVSGGINGSSFNVDMINATTNNPSAATVEALEPL